MVFGRSKTEAGLGEVHTHVVKTCTGSARKQHLYDTEHNVTDVLRFSNVRICDIKSHAQPDFTCKVGSVRRNGLVCVFEHGFLRIVRTSTTLATSQKEAGDPAERLTTGKSMPNCA